MHLPLDPTNREIRLSTQMLIQPLGTTAGENTSTPPDGMTQENILHSQLGTRKPRGTCETGRALWSVDLETALLEGSTRVVISVGGTDHTNQGSGDIVRRHAEIH